MQSTKHRPVLLLTGGGLEHGGGIGRIIGYMAAVWDDKPRPPIKIVDTRGPKGGAIWPLYLARSLLTVLWYAPKRPLLHVHLASNGSTVRKVVVIGFGRLLGLDMVIHLHDPDYGQFYDRLPRWAQSVLRAAFSSTRRVVVLGKEAQDAIHTRLGVPMERIDIVPNAVPAPAPAPREKQRSAPPNLLFLGYLCQRKGVHDLIAALARPELVGLDWEMVLAGGGEEQARFVEQARAAGLTDRVSFRGWVDQNAVEGLLDTADILVLPSYAEGLAMSVLEAMAHGLCIVCTPVGALAETVENDVSACVVSPGDVEGLARALARCITDPELRKRLGQGARNAFEQRFDIKQYPDKILAVYERATA